MKKLIPLLLLSTILSSCAIFRPHKADVNQGNIIVPEDIARIHTGMSEGEVKNIMGNPVLSDIFSDNRVEYVYTYQPGYGQMTEKRLILIFQNGRVREIENR